MDSLVRNESSIQIILADMNLILHIVYLCLFKGDEDSGDCVSTASECVEALRPTCLRPEENCMTNSSLCVNNTWTPCTPAPTECLAGYFCK